MIKKNNKETGFILKGNQNIDKIYRGTDLVFEKGFTREDSGSTPLTTSHESIGENLKDYRIYGNSVQDGTPTPENPVEIESVGDLLLPEEYQQLDYIRNNGSQVIDTGIYPTLNTDVHIKFMPSNNSSAEYVMGSRGSDIFYAVVKTRANSYYTTAFGVDALVNFTDINSVVGDLYELDSTTNGDGTFTATLKDLTQNISQTGSNTIGNITSSPTLKIFGYSTQYIHPAMRVYELKIWQNKELVRNMIPCYRKADDVVGMYDIVNDVFYSNARSGNFIKGDNKKQYRIPIIVSDGTNSTTENIYLHKPLFKIRTEYTSADSLIFQTQKINKKIKEKILDGTETWNSITTSIGNTVYYTTISDISSSWANSLCTHFERDNYRDASRTNVRNHLSDMQINGAYGYTDYYFRYDAMSSVQDFKNFLSTQKSNGTPVKIYYELKTPEEESVDLPTIPSFKGTTTYEIDTNIQPSNMYIKYKGK